MKKHLLPLVFSLLLALPVSPLLHAQEKRQHKEPDTELGKAMESLNKDWRKLRKDVADPTQNATSLEMVAHIKAGLEKGLEYKPEKTADLPEADRAKFVESYQTKMKEFLTLVSQLETALKANDNAAAQDLIKKMGSAQRDDHKEFRRPE